MKQLKQDDIYTILNNKIKNDKYKILKELPQPDSFKDIKKASLRIAQAIHNDETINIVGDYDVDGVISTAIMVEFFSALGVDVNYVIPNRFTHGYGLSPKILNNIYDGLIITVDNGIGAFEAGDICFDRKLDLIITDHHTVGENLPKAYAIINPKQSDCQFPFKDICGAQVAWYLCAMVKKDLQANTINMMIFFDLLSLAIVADIMPMKSLNQTMVKKGLIELQNSKRPCFVALREKFNLNKINEEDIGFKIAPLINCAGRMEDANMALDFLLSFDTFEAQQSLEELILLNEQRKQQQQNIYEEAKLKVDVNDEVVLVASDKWNEGIIGIVASKLSQRYDKPAFVFSINNGIAKGSSRSNDINLYDLIDQCSSALLYFGGHKGAAGMSIESNNLPVFKNMLNETIKNMLQKHNPQDKDNVLGQLKISSIDDNLYNTINNFRPFGLENELPSFVFKDIVISNIKTIGKNKEFTKLIVEDETSSIEALIFIDISCKIVVGDKIDFVATISKNAFMGKITYNLMLIKILNEY
ncbi:Single-stranded-DNA-specific exonuclease RecJ [hydrothermal vent metagenome]|uniref:Single-stranded-DNA-specific exonuclease RecJ n=1 Tax=hydrothermal vent metagenome TaxID=652676 RepID=A0A3B1DTW7_9ZZZZ